tara:strand:+ start:2675 stop:3040 length:366 start_codon:yes stop_codon:yes gene_type:complete
MSLKNNVALSSAALSAWTALRALCEYPEVREALLDSGAARDMMNWLEEYFGVKMSHHSPKLSTLLQHIEEYVKYDTGNPTVASTQTTEVRTLSFPSTFLKQFRMKLLLILRLWMQQQKLTQ